MVSLVVVTLGAFADVNWGYFILRLVIGLSVLGLLFLSQRFWYRAIWQATAKWRITALRVAVRLFYVVALLAIILTLLDGLRMGHRHALPRMSAITVFSGLWFTSVLFGYVAIKGVRVLDRLWTLGHRLLAGNSSSTAIRDTAQIRGGEPQFATVGKIVTAAAVSSTTGRAGEPKDPSRRYFFRAASMAAGAAPFLGVMYGFAAERLNYQVRRVEIPIAKLPPALDGMKIAQLSDIHLSGYMPRSQVRRAVEMANELGADLAVVTGDFITSAGDPLADCIDEIRELRAPLGVWGCNGNHEIYARAEDAAQQLFAQAGMKLLRHENALLTFQGAAFNLIGVDYQRERTPGGHRQQVLEGVEALVRRDVPNILLSHNPNTFNRAAELGIELSLAGHTHGGQIQVEILDHRLSPARFITDYVAGLYSRPLFTRAPDARDARHELLNINPQAAMAQIYVNRGLGTVGAPVRLGVPPEITLIVLRRT
jgi:predicted MPP superfamily phosphohydrolase